MSERIPFSVPQAPINRAFIGLLPWCLAGLMIPLFVGRTTVNAMLITAAICSAMIGTAYWYARRAKWLYLSASGIQGFNKWGFKVNIEWSEQIAFGRANFNGTTCIVIRPTARNTELLLPLLIFGTSEFKSVLEQLAPSQHPLRSVEPSAL